MDWMTADHVLVLLNTMVLSICSGLLLNAIRFKHHPLAIVVQGLITCYALDTLLANVQHLPRP